MPLFKNKKETQKQQSAEIKKAKGRRAKTAQQSMVRKRRNVSGR